MTYIIATKRDREGEQLVRTGLVHPNGMLFDTVKLGTQQKAYGALSLDATTLIARTVTPGSGLSNGTYLIVAGFAQKYKHYDYGGGSDFVPTNEVLRCSHSDVGDAVEKYIAAGASPIRIGLEEKLW